MTDEINEDSYYGDDNGADDDDAENYERAYLHSEEYLRAKEKAQEDDKKARAAHREWLADARREDLAARHEKAHAIFMDRARQRQRNLYMTQKWGLRGSDRPQTASSSGSGFK